MRPRSKVVFKHTESQSPTCAQDIERFRYTTTSSQLDVWRILILSQLRQPDPIGQYLPYMFEPTRTQRELACVMELLRVVSLSSHCC